MEIVPIKRSLILNSRVFPGIKFYIWRWELDSNPGFMFRKKIIVEKKILMM